MKLSDIKSGMVLEVLNCGDVDRLLITDINGEIKAFNREYSLGEINFYFDEDLNDKYGEEVKLLSIYKIIDAEKAPLAALTDDESLELIYTREYNNDCDCEAIQDLEAVVNELVSANEELRKENKLLRQLLTLHTTYSIYNKLN